jgi:hypothetical protein
MSVTARQSENSWESGIDARVDAWLADAAAHRQKAEAHISRAEELEKMVAAARVIQAGTAKRITRRKAVTARKPQKARKKPRKFRKLQAMRLGRQTWTSVLLSIVGEYPEGVTYSDLRERIQATPLGEKLKETDKSFYGGLGKLEAAGALKRHGGRAYSAAAFARIQELIASGKRDELPPAKSGGHRSPIGDAIVEFLKDKPAGAKSAVIVAHLKSLDAPFVQSVHRNDTVAYNVLARLTRYGTLRKNDDEKIYWLSSEGKRIRKESGPPLRSGPVRSEGSHPSLNGSKSLNERLL